LLPPSLTDWLREDHLVWSALGAVRLPTHKRFKRWWTRVIEREPALFAHWRWVRVF
jgi:hypothetical protein